MINDRDYRRVERAIHWIRENADRQPDLAAMAAAADLSPHYFSRLFRRWAGIPPHQFLRTVTLDAAKGRLKHDGNLMGAAWDVGAPAPCGPRASASRATSGTPRRTSWPPSPA